MNKIYFVFEVCYDDCKTKNLRQLSGPFSSLLEAKSSIEQLVSFGFDSDDLIYKEFDEEIYYYGKN